MTLKIAVASGKGGTGKTTLSCGLAWSASQANERVTLVDCDVEEPNVNLFLQSPVDTEKEVFVLNPQVDKGKCTGCGACGEMCQFSAIVVINKEVLLFSDMCHSCGGCVMVCPQNAITEIKRPIGIVEKGSMGSVQYLGGRMNVGEAKSPPLIQAVAGETGETDLVVFDAPPGTSCPVIETARESDFVILVTEPTPFGLHDLTLAVEMIRELRMPFGVVINRSDAGDDSVEKYCREEGITVLGSIPFSRKIAEAYAEGKVIQTLGDIYGTILSDILNAVRQRQDI